MKNKMLAKLENGNKISLTEIFQDDNCSMRNYLVDRIQLCTNNIINNKKQKYSSGSHTKKKITTVEE